MTHPLRKEAPDDPHAQPGRVKDLGLRSAAELFGTLLLVGVLAGTAIVASRTTDRSLGATLVATTIASGAAVTVLVLLFGRVSGAHLNPSISVAAAILGDLTWFEAACYVVAQFAGALAAVALLAASPLFTVEARASGSALFSEFFTSFGLLCVVVGCAARRLSVTPLAVGLFVSTIFWFSSSTSFANPAVALAGAAARHEIAGSAATIVAELAGALAAVGLMRWLVAAGSHAPVELVVPRRRLYAAPFDMRDREE
jgi:glycerol uptake facilitator-like aquaporin